MVCPGLSHHCHLSYQECIDYYEQLHDLTSYGIQDQLSDQEIKD